MSDSIKVAIKVRPLIKREKDENLPIQWMTQENSIIAIDAEIKKRGDGRFTFDHIFDMDASNKDVFDNIVKPIVDATVNGFNGTVFAYGQTSSGKTYTMMGNSEEIGIIPLAIEHIFDAIANTPGREFLLRVSYLEIYKERVNDLLTKDEKDLKVHEDANGQVFVHCKEEVTNCPENVLSIMHKGNKNRRIGETNMNERSSRSHTIFRITIESREADADSDGAIQVSQLNMVDLAGSERARQTGATGERFNEGRHINLSLSTLALVIKQLSESQESQKYVNFRDSKLTRLLQASLGGNAMTAIICAITPAALDETQCTLSFASRARNVKNKPQLNEVMSDGVLLKRYAKQIDKLHAELKKLKQLAPADFQEMEFRIQEKDRINQNLEERIRLLQTKIVHGDTRNNPETFKSREKRRQTWCGAGVSKLNTSVPSWMNLTPIEEMSPCKSHNRKSTDIMDKSFQIVFQLADFELELMKSEEARDTENDSDDDFVTYRRENRVKFHDDVIIHKPSINNDSCNSISEKIDTSTQTTGLKSPGTPKQTLRDRIHYLSKEYSQLQEYTTLEKQLYIEDYNCETKEKLTKLSMLEKQLENITSDKDAFEHIAVELRKELTTVEMRYALAKDQLNAQATELQRILDLENKIAQLTAQKMEIQNIPELQKQVTLLTAEKDEYKHIASELQKKLNEVEQRSILLENKLATQRNYINDTEKFFIQPLSKNEHVQQIETELKTPKITIIELQEKLKEEELCNDSVKEKFNVQQVELLKTIDEQKKCIESFAIEKNKLEDTVRELQEKSRETKLHNNLLQDKINEQELQLQTHDLKEKIEYLTLKIKGSEYTIYELQEKLIKTEQCTSVKDEQLQKIQELEAEITKLKSEREEYEQAFMKCKLSVTNQRENTHLKQVVPPRMTDHDCEDILLNNSDSSKVIEDLSLTRISLEEENTKLFTDLLLKNQELDEIKHDVQSLKADTENLQKTIYLLTMENSELANKLTEEKECAKKSAVYFQHTIDELYARNSKIIDEKFNLENNLALLNEQIESLCSKTSEQNLSVEQINFKYEERINTLTVKNAELVSNIADTKKELETLKESKSLLYEHDCMYKDKLTDLVEKLEYLTIENNELSTDLLNRVEENDGLRQECNILKSKLELSLRNKEDINDNDVEQLKTENTLLKIKLIELETNMKDLTKENSKMSNQLIETLEDLDHTRKINSCDNDLNTSSLFNISIMKDTIDKSMKEDSAETKILKLEETVNNLMCLNRKLSDLKSSVCTECVYLKESSKSQRIRKLEAETFDHKLENAQRKFDRKSAISDSLILKAKEDVNISIYNTSFNSSVSENMNVSYMEDRLESLNNELQSLKEDHKTSDLYKEKSNEVNKSQNSDMTDLTCEVNFGIKKSPSRTWTRIKNIEKTMSHLQIDLEKLKENTVSVKIDLAKFTNEKELSLLDEINSLKIANEQLLQNLSESKVLYTAALEKVNIYENNIKDMTKTFKELNATYDEIEKAKLFLEVEAESLKEEQLMKEQTISELRQNLSCLQYELDLMKKQNDKLNDDNNSMEQEYEKKLELLKATNEECTTSKTIISQNFANYSKKSEIRLAELDEKINKYISENDYLKQELIKLRDIENKFEKMKTEYQFKSQQDKTLIDENKNLKNALNNVSKNIIKEIKSLNPKVDIEEFEDKSANELYQIFLQTILIKEDEMAKIMRKQFDKEKQKLEDEKQQSVDATKRMTLWTKELESEIEKLQGDLSERETASNELQKEVKRLEHLLQENNRDRDALREKINLLELDFGNLQIEFNRYSKIDTANGEAMIIAQKREKQAQETIKNKEAEYQIRLKSEKEMYNKQLEDLKCTIESLKTKNMELTNNIEGLEANQKQLKNIIDLKINELMKNHQIIQKMQMESEQLTEAYNDLNLELEQKTSHIAKITELLKNKCDELTEYKTNFDAILSENKLLKQQINERKASIEQHKMKIEKLEMEKKEEIDAIKDKLNIEEVKSVELNNQITELYNKNSALTEEISALKDDYLTLQCKCVTLEKKVRNSTSKIHAEEQMEELKDLNRSLRNNLDGASNRITELQATKTDLMKQLVTLNSQYKAICKDNEELKKTLSSYKFKYNDTCTNCEKYDVLLQEKNKVALELEAIKVQLNKKNQEVENCTNKMKELTEKNTELDQELEDLANVIRQYDVDNTRLLDKYYTCRNEIEQLQNKIRDLEKENQDLQLQCTERNVSSDKTQKSYDGEYNYTALQSKIRELQLEVISKNGKIATLELQIRSGSFPYEMKCGELQEQLSVYKNKISELKAEVTRLMLRTSTRECDVCKQKFVNRKTQACQTMPTNVLRFCGTSSGIIEDEIKIAKLEKEKQIMKNVCRSRSKTIKDLEQRIQELEQLVSHS